MEDKWPILRRFLNETLDKKMKKSLDPNVQKIVMEQTSARAFRDKLSKAEHLPEVSKPIPVKTDKVEPSPQKDVDDPFKGLGPVHQQELHIAPFQALGLVKHDDAWPSKRAISVSAERAGVAEKAAAAAAERAAAAAADRVAAERAAAERAAAEKAAAAAEARSPKSPLAIPPSTSDANNPLRYVPPFGSNDKY